VLIGPQARVEGNLLCDGCQIYGQVIRSVIAPGVIVAPGAVVRDSILLTDTVVEQDTVVDRCILDKETFVGASARVGDGEDNTPNQAAPERLNTGLTVIGRRARIPAKATIGRNVVIMARTTETAFSASLAIPSGRTVGRG
jgi:glucose-1-phosphate adenylyltransferase